MKEDLRKHISQFCSFTSDQLFEILSKFEYESLKKNEFFYQAGKICRKVGFIRTGSVRSFNNIDGNEVTRFVLVENNFFTAFESFFSIQPSPEFVQAIEKTELYTITKTNLDELCAKFPEMLKLTHLATVESHLRIEKRVFNLIALSAEERYILFEKENAHLLSRIPLQYVASILGMKPETLSRIRKKLKS